jgi:hypothetical protein
MISSSKTIGKAEARRQSEAITHAGHTKNVVLISELYTGNIVFFMCQYIIYLENMKGRAKRSLAPGIQTT